VKSTLIVAGLIGAASAGGFAFAAPASAACAPSFTSIPCTIVTNVASAPVDVANGLATTAPQLVGVGCPKDDDGNATACGLPAVPGQLFTGIATLPVQALVGANQIATAPGAIAGNLAAAPGQLAGGLAAAPGQFVRAITHGGTDPESQ
jgi:hypothetical protein